MHMAGVVVPMVVMAVTVMAARAVHMSGMAVVMMSVVATGAMHMAIMTMLMRGDFGRLAQ